MLTQLKITGCMYHVWTPVNIVPAEKMMEDCCRVEYDLIRQCLETTLQDRDQCWCCVKNLNTLQCLIDGR